jgi:hypothetical protein
VAIVYAYADILAVMAKQHRVNQMDPESANWLIWEGFPAWMNGEDPDEDQRPAGSFKAPGSAFDGDRQVAQMRDFKHKGVGAVPQISCGIFNKAFYETAKRLGDTEHAGQIWIEALRNVGNAKELTATKFAGLLENSAGPEKPKIQEALEVVGIQSLKPPPHQNPVPSPQPTPSPLTEPTTSPHSRISQRLVNTSLGDFNGRDVAVASVQQNDPQNLLVKKASYPRRLHESIRVVELLRTGVFSFGYGAQAQSSNNSLGLTLWKELP